MGTTSPLAFPFPEPTDAVAAGAAAIKALAEAIDDKLALPIQHFVANGGGAVTADTGAGGQAPGLAVDLGAKPYPRVVFAFCTLGLSWISGGSNSYWAGVFNWTGAAKGGPSRQWFFARTTPSTGNGAAVATIAANVPTAYLSISVRADVAASANLSSTVLDVVAIPVGVIT